MKAWVEYKGKLYTAGDFRISHIEGSNDQYLSFDNGEPEGFISVKNPYLAKIDMDSMWFLDEEDNLLVASPHKNNRIITSITYDPKPEWASEDYLELFRQSFAESRKAKVEGYIPPVKRYGEGSSFSSELGAYADSLSDPVVMEQEVDRLSNGI